MQNYFRIASREIYFRIAIHFSIPRNFASGSCLKFTSGSRLNLLQDRVFECLRWAKTYHCLGLDLDRFACLRITTHARLAVRFHGSSDAWDNELARAALRFFHGELEKLFEK